MQIVLWIVGIGAIFFLSYGIFPTVLLRMFSIGMVKIGEFKKTLFLTFDDGPNPVYTPQVLDLLKKYDVKATFFVVAEKVLDHPELIRRMRQEGHTIGIHHYHHTNSWFLTPWSTKREISRSVEIIENLTGVKPAYYRPPYGRFNLFTLFFARDFTIVLWSAIFQDWRNGPDASGLQQRLIARISEGQIYLLHDDGEDAGADSDAPAQMIEALKGFLPHVRRRGFRCVSLEEHLGKKSTEEQKWSV
ncbi:polysaccharide deacetylase family protein [Bacillus sp. Marseille-Q3570]|uniref:polysaccharide deacetylase family protein n=1 Tax=Bacillus sp. Marseille-Q3570 TaxID=2963522 RepID=UPI0021B7234F|nr:polysaccharide deacetylase family protein [Bacillus sp. Marseille-Q3570]